MCGGAADCQFWVRVLAQHCSLHALQVRRIYADSVLSTYSLLQEKEIISVAAASKVLANMLARYRGMGLSVYTMVAGYDKTGMVVFPSGSNDVHFCRSKNLSDNERRYSSDESSVLSGLWLDVRHGRA